MNATAHSSGGLPVTILGGYLGAGKTTLVNHLLRHAAGLRIAVLVNDFGSIDIDADLIEAREGNVVRLAGGCACCTIGSDFTSGMAGLSRLGTFDHAVVEASGVALPGSMRAALTVLKGVRLTGIVVVADAENVRTHAMDAYVGDVVRAQLAAADVLVLNKSDRCPPSEMHELREWAGCWSPNALVLPATRCAVERSLILSQYGPAAGNESTDEPSGPRYVAAPDAAHANRLFVTTTLDVPGPVDAASVAAELAAARLERAKGIVLDKLRGWVVLQVVGDQWSVDPAVRRPVAAAGRIVCISRRTSARAGIPT